LPEQHRPEIASLNSAVRFVAGGTGFFLSSFLVARSFSFAFFVIGVLFAVTLLLLNPLIGATKNDN